MNLSKGNTVGILLIAAIFLNGCASDLRSRSFRKKGIDTESAQKGRELLGKAAQAHGFDNWYNFETTNVEIQHHFKGMGRMAVALPPKVTVLYQCVNKTFDVKATILNSKKKGEVWGVVNDVTYTVPAGSEEAIWKHKFLGSFFLKTMHYFTSYYFRILEATVIGYIGEEEWNGTKYDLVFASWGEKQPNKEMDQYIIWINQETGLIEHSQFTVRDMPGSFMKGWVSNEDFRNVNGVIIPFKQTERLSLEGKSFFHQWTLNDLGYDQCDKSSIQVK
ncbi:MAG: hypothetical protein JKY18_13660 [Flavobacteriales bacterium]|nr:hypothetical protein [Flavobacteriales bacterium]MBL4736355.1 hypothetical protein [Flavobacteriales bacterium]